MKLERIMNKASKTIEGIKDVAKAVLISLPFIHFGTGFSQDNDYKNYKEIISQIKTPEQAQEFLNTLKIKDYNKCYKKAITAAALLKDDGFELFLVNMYGNSGKRSGHTICAYKINDKFGAVGEEGEYRHPYYNCIERAAKSVTDYNILEAHEMNDSELEEAEEFLKKYLEEEAILSWGYGY